MAIVSEMVARIMRSNTSVGFKSDHRVLSYNRALELTGCERIEATLRAGRLLWAEALTRMDDCRLPKRVMFGTIKDGVKKGRGGQE